MSAAMPTMRPVLYLSGTMVTVPVSVSGVFDARFRYSISWRTSGPTTGDGRPALPLS